VSWSDARPTSQARIALARGEIAEARRLQEDGLRVVAALAQESRLEVASLSTLARIDVAENRLDEAASRYAEALTSLSTQVRRLGASLDVEAAFVDETDLQRPYVDLLLALGRQDEALETMERFRARAVLDRLATRDLAFGRSGEAADVARERRRLSREYDNALAQLGRLSPVSAPDQVRALQRRLGEIRASQAAAGSNLRRVDASLAERLDPTPLALPELRRSLAPDTLALVYHLGVTHPAVFAVSRAGLRVAPLPASSEELTRRVNAWRSLVDRGRTDRVPSRALDDESRALYQSLIAPVEVEVRAARRLVIVPDGPLHGLSFAALRRPPADGGPERYVAEWKPTSVAPSLTVLAELSSRPKRPAGARSAAVFGDAQFAGTASGGGSVERSAGLEMAGALEPLPGSRREAERVAAVFAPRATLRLGPDATEEAVKRLPRDTGVLHLASHGIANDVAPLESAIVLTATPDPQDGDNGLLQAWEIFDQLRLDADLVALSACDTGLGRTFGAEGLLGLTRAFQFAGARVVAASLWKAPDDATATLMAAFYAEYGRGRSPDDALARAQGALLRHADTRHPFAWAGFVLDGDSR
jgi:CHAT domain-containing protein